ncbi:MAG: hypothetical protein FD143_3067, partial [Ignavibacteria bacterium]
QLIDAAGNAERSESGPNAERMVECTERVAGESAALDTTGASRSEPAYLGASTLSTSKEVARSPSLKAFAYLPATQTLATEYAFPQPSPPPYLRQEGLNEASTTAQGIDVLASQTIQAGGGIKRVHAKLIIGNNKPPKLFIEPARAIGSSSNGNAGIDDHQYHAGSTKQRTPAKRGRPCKRNALDQSS